MSVSQDNLAADAARTEARSRDIHGELAAAEGLAARLRLQIAHGTCAEVGHDWQFLGGANAGCHSMCSCSVPVCECAKCGDCDYGDTPEATEIRKECAELRCWS